MVARIDNIGTKPALTDVMGMTGILGSAIAFGKEELPVYSNSSDRTLQLHKYDRIHIYCKSARTSYCLT